MIIIKLNGGLGNQMFQYAIGRRLQNKLGTELFLDITAYDEQPSKDTKREYELDNFKVHPKFADKKLIEKIKGNRGTHMERVLNVRLPSFTNKIFSFGNSYFLENGDQKFEDRILNITGDAYLEGYWQSYKYFDDIKNLLTADFSIRKQMNSQNKKWLRHIKNTNSVAVHVRRGDYVAKYSDYFQSCGPSYYQTAIKKINALHKDLSIFVFSDDQPWARKNMKFKFPTYFPDHNKGKNNFLDLPLMQSCKHNIIANSSFSWWAAYLNPNKKKIVVAPEKWLVNQKFDISDRVPPTWIIL